MLTATFATRGLTQTISTDDLQRLLEIAAGQAARVTADPDLVDLGDLLRDELAAEIHDRPNAWSDERPDWSIRFTTPSAGL